MHNYYVFIQKQKNKNKKTKKKKQQKKTKKKKTKKTSKEKILVEQNFSSQLGIASIPLRHVLLGMMLPSFSFSVGNDK